RLQPLAEARDLLPQRYLVDAPVVDVCDEQPRRIRPEVDRSDAPRAPDRRSLAAGGAGLRGRLASLAALCRTPRATCTVTSSDTCQRSVRNARERHFRGYTAVSHANESSESCSAARRTASRATERRSRSTL